MRTTHPFSQSIWIAVAICFVIYVIVFALTYRRFAKGQAIYFDPKHTPEAPTDAGDYNSHAARYQDLAKLVIALSSGAIAFLVNIYVAEAKTPAAKDLVRVAPVVVSFFGCSIALLVAFMFSQCWFYETYCHKPQHDSYTRSHYALGSGFGWTGLCAFLLGFGWLAQNVFG